MATATTIAIAVITLLLVTGGITGLKMGLVEQSAVDGVPIVEKPITDPTIVVKQVRGMKIDYTLECFDDPYNEKSCSASLNADGRTLTKIGVARCALKEPSNPQSGSIVTEEMASDVFVEVDGTLVVGKTLTLESACAKAQLQKAVLVQRVECNTDVDCRLTTTSNVYRTFLGKCVEDVDTDPVCVYQGFQEGGGIVPAPQRPLWPYVVGVSIGAVLLALIVFGVIVMVRKKR